MKTNRLLRAVALVVCILAVFAGCKRGGKSGDGSTAKEPKITGSPSDPPVAIDVKWAAGQRYIMRLESSQSYQLPNFAAMARRGGAGQTTNNPPLQNNFAQDYALVVTNATDGQRGIEMEILGLELLASQGDQEFVNYMSRSKVGNQGGGPMMDVFDRLIGGKIYFLVGTDNKVIKVEGINELFERVEPGADAGGRGGLGAGGFGGGGMLRNMYNEDLFKTLIEMAGAPPSAVRVGENWTTTQEANAPVIGKLAITTTNTLRGFQEHDGRKCARVEFTGAIVFSTNAAATPMAGFMKLQDGTVVGNYWFSPDLSIPVETVARQEMVITITVPDFGGGRRGRGDAAPDATATNATQSFSAPMKQNILMKLVEVKSI